jgi:cytochrome P450
MTSIRRCCISEPSACQRRLATLRNRRQQQYHHYQQQTTRAVANVPTTTQQTTQHTTGNDNSSSIELKRIPALPYIGSMIPLYSAIPHYRHDTVMDFWPQVSRQYGEFYTIGMPVIGEGLYGTIHTLQDPHEMMHVMRSEGKNPSSLVTWAWPMKQFYQTHNLGRVGDMFEHGERWKVVRSFLQKDLLSPSAAQSYIPGIITAARHASKGAPHHADRLNHFLNQASFDMINSFLLGQFPRLADPATPTQPEDALFCESVTTALRSAHVLTLSVKENILAYTGYTSQLYQQFEHSWETVIDIAGTKIRQLHDKQAQGTLNEHEQASYWNQAYIRRVHEHSILTADEVDYITYFLLGAGVDTTSAKLAWHILHASLNEEAQEKVYHEVVRFAQQQQQQQQRHTTSSRHTSRHHHDDGKLLLHEDYFTAANSPYLHAFLRESHRLTCPLNLTPLRSVTTPVTVHGIDFPAGTIFALDVVSKSYDPTSVDDPESFRLERWMPDAVQARKGTRAEALDHPLYSGPFSQGVRRCPGSRVTMNESMVLLAQLVMDWKLSLPGYSSWREVPYDLGNLDAPILPRVTFELRAVYR